MIDYAQKLNAAQLEAVTYPDGPILVVAGAGTGKTRTIVYRLAWLVEHGVPNSSILLLTFTRKAAAEMLNRAGNLLDQGSLGIQGGTFHAFAFSVLRRYPPLWLEGRRFTVMDGPDISDAMAICKESVRDAKGTSFPKPAALVSLFSKARNLELPLRELVMRDYQHLLMYLDALEAIEKAYSKYRRENCLLDFDDLLHELEALLSADDADAAALRRRYSHILVDEYQDTNRIQARLTRLLATPLAGETGGNVMAVGDEAQSIYSFRGASVRNILDFPETFPGAVVVRLEENYRSTQPILDVANHILLNASESYRKKLFTRRGEGVPVRLVRPLNADSQAQHVAKRITDFLNAYAPSQIAVLFRAGFHSFSLEVALSRASIPFRKYGGLRYTESAHTRDFLSFARLVVHVGDLPAFTRVAAMHPGVGAKTAKRFHDIFMKDGIEALEKALAKHPDLADDIAFVREHADSPPGVALPAILERYTPRLQKLYPMNWPKRAQDLDELLRMSAGYTDMELFLADISLEVPDDKEGGEHVVLSTVHSAKGLEWDAVFIIDLVEDRFPSYHAKKDRQLFEEERRLFYVACTRARHRLELYSPLTVFNQKYQSNVTAEPSCFVSELPSSLREEWVEMNNGKLVCATLRSASGSPRTGPVQAEPVQAEPVQAKPVQAEPVQTEPIPSAGPAKEGAPCRHRIFGEGKIVKLVTHEAAEVSFANHGIKTIMVSYLTFDDPPLETIRLEPVPPADPAKEGAPCRHRIFGEGKIVRLLSPEMAEVSFANHGIKTIMTSYLIFDD
ncbi:MAG: ATP-dependent helicase [Desulfovibrio sp.]|jgi:DNA helicase-2/ATP-dependent DNA helicase PcrA|nr:ATP-dependent helicase [Desulfovibrio sp.]